jgi:CBS domain-containing protein
MKARDLMSTKVVTVSPDTPVREIAALMVEKHISGVPVVDKDDSLVGMISEGDLLRRPELGTEKHHRRRWLSFFIDAQEDAQEFTKTHAMRAEDVMTKSVSYVGENTSLGDVVSKMEKENVKRLPVLTDGRMVGIVSRVDLLRMLATRQAEPLPAPPENDAAIRATINDVLKNEDWAQSAMINVIVSDGVVHLWGVIDSKEQRQALRVAAENIPGVKEVEEHLSFSLPT